VGGRTRPDDLSYADLAALLNEIVIKQREEAIEAERRRSQRHQDELEAWFDRLDAETP
jgi:hypothetical protein